MGVSRFNEIGCYIFKLISPFKDQQYLSRNKSMPTKRKNLTIFGTATVEMHQTVVIESIMVFKHVLHNI